MDADENQSVPGTVGSQISGWFCVEQNEGAPAKPGVRGTFTTSLSKKTGSTLSHLHANAAINQLTQIQPIRIEVNLMYRTSSRSFLTDQRQTLLWACIILSPLPVFLCSAAVEQNSWRLHRFDLLSLQCKVYEMMEVRSWFWMSHRYQVNTKTLKTWQYLFYQTPKILEIQYQQHVLWTDADCVRSRCTLTFRCHLADLLCWRRIWQRDSFKFPVWWHPYLWCSVTPETHRPSRWGGKMDGYKQLLMTVMHREDRKENSTLMTSVDDSHWIGPGIHFLRRFNVDWIYCQTEWLPVLIPGRHMGTIQLNPPVSVWEAAGCRLTCNMNVKTFTSVREAQSRRSDRRSGRHVRGESVAHVFCT